MRPKLNNKLTDFEKRVLAELLHIPAGRVTTYARLALRIGQPRASRAVGNALNKNPDAPLVPCHRVVKSDGSVGGYEFGIDQKIKLLKKEGVIVREGKVLNFREILI